MTEINTRPSFFPNSPSANQSSKTRNANYPSEIGESRVNSSDRIEELNNATSEHVRVDIPDSIKDYAAIKTAVDQAEPLDNSAKIAAIKEKINAGKYVVDDEAVANKMLTNEF